MMFPVSGPQPDLTFTEQESGRQGRMLIIHLRQGFISPGSIPNWCLKDDTSFPRHARCDRRVGVAVTSYPMLFVHTSGLGVVLRVVPLYFAYAAFISSPVAPCRHPRRRCRSCPYHYFTLYRVCAPLCLSLASVPAFHISGLCK